MLDGPRIEVVMRGSGFPNNENHHLSSPADVHLEFESYRLLLGLDSREFSGIGNGKSRENSNENDYLSSPSDASGI